MCVCVGVYSVRVFVCVWCVVRVMRVVCVCSECIVVDESRILVFLFLSRDVCVSAAAGRLVGRSWTAPRRLLGISWHTLH